MYTFYVNSFWRTNLLWFFSLRDIGKIIYAIFDIFLCCLFYLRYHYFLSLLWSLHIFMKFLYCFIYANYCLICAIIILSVLLLRNLCLCYKSHLCIIYVVITLSVLIFFNYDIKFILIFGKHDKRDPVSIPIRKWFFFAGNSLISL